VGSCRETLKKIEQLLTDKKSEGLIYEYYKDYEYEILELNSSFMNIYNDFKYSIS